LDWPNLVEEVEDLGRSELHAVVSLLSRALEHLLKVAGWPASHDAGHWKSEVATFLSDAADRWAPSMEQRVDLAMLYQRARARTTVTTADGQDPAWLPAENPFVISELIVAAPGIADVCGLVATLDTAAASAGPAR